MGGDDIVVGKPASRTHSQVIIAHLAAAAGSPDRQKVDRQEGSRPRFCGAMSQQRDDSGAQSIPQKLVRLVGCRDPKARLSLKR